MSRYQVVKMYQAVSESICITEFGAQLLPGWFATSKEALAAFRPEPIKHDEPRKPGRPKKVQ